MARSFDSGSSQYLTYSGTVTTRPLTISAWVYIDGGTTSTENVVALDADSPAGNYYVLQIIWDTDHYEAWFAVGDGSGSYAISTASLSTSTWYHVCCVEYSASSRSCFVNAANEGTNTSTKGEPTVDTIRIGAAVPAGSYFDGKAAEIAIYNDALNDDEIGILAKGFSPLLVRPGNLAFLLPSIRDEDRDIIGGRVFTPINSPTVTEHPRVIYPGMQSIIRAPSAIISGDTCWGHDTDVLETNIRDFSGDWTGTGTIENAGVADTERLALESGEYMESPVVETGAYTVTLIQNNYAVGNDVTMEYRHAATEAGVSGASYNTYTVPFTSLGYVQIKLTSTL